MIFRLFFIISLVAGLSNCVATQTFPKAARAGDTITLAVGSVDGLNKNNVTIEFVHDSDPSNPIDITTNIRSVLKINPDKTSKGYWDTTSGNGYETMTYYVSTLSLHGPWQSVIVIDLPDTLPVGFGVFQIQFGNGVRTPITVASANNVDIGIEILPSPGSSNLFEYRKEFFNTNTNLGDFSLLEANRQLVLRTPMAAAIGVSEPVAAAEYTLTVPVVDQLNVDVTNMLNNDDFAVVLDDQPTYVKNQVNLIWSRKNSEFKVIVLNSTGLLDVNLIRFSILISNLELSETNGWMLSENTTLDVVKFYDIDGDEIARPMPEILIQN